MLTTEEEAATKWCPNTRVIPGTLSYGRVMQPSGIYAHNRVQVRGEEESEPTWHTAMNCIGSKCQAWRWWDTLSDDGAHCVRTLSAREAGPSKPRVAPLQCRRGFCGAFGRPE